MAAVELIVRTCKPEYTSGDTVHGCVYLRISSPISAYGVWLRFHGFEKYMYSAKRLSTPVGQGNMYSDSKEYFPADKILLFEDQEPMPLGQYVFPFQKELQLDLQAGGVQLHSASGAVPQWNVEVVYRIEAILMGAESITASQKIVITQPSLASLAVPCSGSLSAEGLSSPVGGVKEVRTIQLQTAVPFLKIQAVFTVELDKKEYRIGENLKLSVGIETNGIFKPHINRLKCELYREFRIAFAKLPNAKNHASVQFSNWPQWLLRAVKDEDEFSPDVTIPKGYVHPEGPHTVVWSGQVSDSTGTSLDRGVKEMLIPLKGEHCNFIPTTIGSHIALIYFVKIQLDIIRNDSVIFQLPVCCVWASSKEWYKWKPSDWLNECHVKTSRSSACFVSENLLESVVFAAMPSFQVV